MLGFYQSVTLVLRNSVFYNSNKSLTCVFRSNQCRLDFTVRSFNNPIRGPVRVTVRGESKLLLATLLHFRSALFSRLTGRRREPLLGPRRFEIARGLGAGSGRNTGPYNIITRGTYDKILKVFVRVNT